MIIFEKVGGCKAAVERVKAPITRMKNNLQLTFNARLICVVTSAIRLASLTALRAANMPARSPC